MIRASSRLALVAALLSVTACDEERITLDSGDPSTLEVRAYVDANGSGTFDAGDPAVSGATVTASGPIELSATTGDDGRATLDGLIPGSYTLSLSGSAPAGAVLATATNPVVTAPFGGAALDAEFRYSFRPGSITGRLWRDDNQNGAFDADADLVAVGIPVTAVREGGGTAETVTGADGTFELPGLRPGTWTLTFGLPEDAQIVGGGPITIVVDPTVATAVEAVFEGDLLIDIAQARAAPEGQVVTVTGTITWAPDFDGRALFVQDETGGISIFDFNLPDGLEEGDRVQLTGTRGSFDGEVQISPLSAFDVLGSGATPVPAQVTAAEIQAGEHLGELVSINGTVEQVDVLSFGNQMVLLRDGDGTTFAVKVDSRTGIEADTWDVGTLYGVTGVLGTDTNESGTDIEVDHPNRVEPRFESDVQRGGATTPIGDAREAIGSTVVVQGVITWAPDFDGRVIFFQDETGGITVFDSNLSDFAPEGGFARGDLIRMNATVSAFRGEVQLGSVVDVELLGNVALPGPEGVSAASINAGEDQGELVTATGTVTNVEVLSFGNQRVTLEDDGGTAFAVYADSRTGVTADDWTVGTRYRVTGVLGTDDRDALPYRIEVRGDEDVVEAPGTTVSIAEARAMPGATVTVTGTVSRVLGWTNRQAFIQDETGGVTLFTFDGLPALAPGDIVTVTGDVGAFNGEVQIGPTDVTVTGSTAEPTPLDVTGAQINAGLFQGMLIEISGTITEVVQANSFGSAELTVSDADGTPVTVFVDNRSGLAFADFAVGQEVTIVGVLGFFDGNDPGAQVEVIVDTDVTFAG